MHRTLALKSTRRYVKTETYSSIPLIINASESWDFNLKLYRDVVISSGAILTINNTFVLPYNGSITVNNGAALVIVGTIQLADNNKIIVKNGGTIKLSSGSNNQIIGSGKIEIESGGYICIESGAVINLQDYLSVINLRNGYQIGLNPSITGLTGTCSSSPANFSTLGNGSINSFSNNKYIQNQTFTLSDYLTGLNIFAGSNVTTDNPPGPGPVKINSGTTVIFDAEGDVLLDKDFEAANGADLEIK
jgi:hypothetical protein